MKIIFDASVLGLGVYSSAARTGIYRVAIQILKGLVQQKNIEIGIVSTENLVETLQFLKINFPENNFQLINNQRDIQKARIENFCLNVFPLNSTPQKVLRKVILKLRGNNSEFRIDTEKITNFQLYYSPFLPIPKEINQLPIIKKAITVYDLIPLVFPNYTTQWSTDNIKKVLDSIAEDTKVASISASTKTDLLKFTDLNSENIHVIPIAADTKLFQKVTDRNKIKAAKQTYGISEVPYFLSVSTLEPRKNFETTIKAFTHFVETNATTNIQLVLVGTKGWKFEKIFDELKASPQVQSKIIFTGFVADNDLPALYSGALGFVFPTLYEGFGLTPLEAMLCGTPVISSNNSSIPEVVGDAGILVEATNVVALSEAMFSIYSDAELRENLKIKAFKKAKEFSEERTVSDYLALFQSLVS